MHAFPIDNRNMCYQELQNNFLSFKMYVDEHNYRRNWNASWLTNVSRLTY